MCQLLEPLYPVRVKHDGEECVHCAKYVQMAVNKRTLLMKDEMKKYSVTESHATNTMLLIMCEADQVQVS